jgi:hypothetical protein
MLMVRKMIIAVEFIGMLGDSDFDGGDSWVRSIYG